MNDQRSVSERRAENLSENIAVTTTDHTASACKQCSPKDMALGRCDCLRDIYSASRRSR